MTGVVLRARVTMQDDMIPHQIRLRFTTNDERTRSDMIGVFCKCSGTPLARRFQWDDPGEPIRIWRQHMAVVVAAS